MNGTRFVVQPVRPIIGWTRTICPTMESAEREREAMEFWSGVKWRIYEQRAEWRTNKNGERRVRRTIRLNLTD